MLEKGRSDGSEKHAQTIDTIRGVCGGGSKNNQITSARTGSLGVPSLQQSAFENWNLASDGLLMYSSWLKVVSRETRGFARSLEPVAAQREEVLSWK